MNEVDFISDCVYYDVELKRLSKDFDDLYKVFKEIKKRADRRQTLQISKSVFDYYERKQDFKVCPQRYFDFRYNNVHIALYRFRGALCILLVGCELPSGFALPQLNDFCGSGILYGPFDDENYCKLVFADICYEVIGNDIL